MSVDRSVNMGNLDKFFGTRFGGAIPWMASCEADVAVEFDLRMESLDVIDSEVPWRDASKGEHQAEAEAEMRDIQTADGVAVADDATHVVPFWAADALKECLVASKLRKGWAKLVYKRSTYREISKRTGEKTDYNTAAFAERG